MTEYKEERPWESAPVLEAQHLFECPNVIGWHDETFYSGDELYWYEGDEKYPAGWLCHSCHFHIRDDLYGFRSPEMHAWYDAEKTMPTLSDEIERRFGEGVRECRLTRATIE